MFGYHKTRLCWTFLPQLVPSSMAQRGAWGGLPSRWSHEASSQVSVRPAHTNPNSLPNSLENLSTVASGLNYRIHWLHLYNLQEAMMAPGPQLLAVHTAAFSWGSREVQWEGLAVTAGLACRYLI